MSDRFEKRTYYSEEDPEGTRYMDKDGDLWYREGDVWYIHTATDQIEGYGPSPTGINESWKSILDIYGPLTVMPRDETPQLPKRDQKYILGNALGYFGLWIRVQSAWLHPTERIYADSSDFKPGWEDVRLMPSEAFDDLLEGEDAEQARQDFSDAVQRRTTSYYYWC